MNRSSANGDISVLVPCVKGTGEPGQHETVSLLCEGGVIEVVFWVRQDEALTETKHIDLFL